MGSVFTLAECTDAVTPCLSCFYLSCPLDRMAMQLLFQSAAQRSKAEEDVTERHVYELEIQWRNKPRIELKKPKELHSVKLEGLKTTSNVLKNESSDPNWFQGKSPEQRGPMFGGIGVPSMGADSILQ